MVLDAPGRKLRPARLPAPVPGRGQLLLRVLACGVCRTDLHLVDGELPEPKLPVIPGHEIVGEVVAAGPGALGFTPGQRAGVPWLGHSCGRCPWCREGRENLCNAPGFTGYTLDGGYAEHCLAEAAWCFALPASADPAETAPLLCAGLIGWRSLVMAGAARSIGLYGFGAAAHLLAQILRARGRTFMAFTRPGDVAAQAFARALGADWAGGSDEPPPERLDAAIVFAPEGGLVPVALRAVRKGGTVVLGGIHMSDIPSFPYRLLWEERVLRSVANLTRADGEAFLAEAAACKVRCSVQRYPLARANEALADLRAGRVQGAAVLVPPHGCS
ncbi:zinc-dependent alcohol dehydrogenase family protein [Rhodospirillales bacterium YIM 152171]|uniref:Zinc-dependent alcohol dehydrogenase family protein n=2 Tax=Marinimicrococcus flavescens TaxID=3031815 RepID=A0AAP3XPD7_9PROT|nr:zinc-dependent alcohol dehydrogenase family protein [Marinimicrococcus flavescens]